MIERWHRMLRVSLMSDASPRGTELLLLVTLNLQASVKEDLGISSVEMVCGQTLILPAFLRVNSPPTATDLTSLTWQLQVYVHLSNQSLVCIMAHQQDSL